MNPFARNPKNLFRLGAVIAVGALISAPYMAHDAVESANRVAATAALAESTGFHSEQLSVYRVIASSVAEHNASEAIIEANTIIAAVSTKVDATSLSASVASLGQYKNLSDQTIRELTAKTKAEAQAAATAGAEVDRAAAEAAAAAAAAAAEAQRVANTPDGARNTARAIAAGSYGWGDDQFSCLSQLWQKESRWDLHAQNNDFSPSSAPIPANQAYGIAQSGPGSKMGSVGADWETNASTQVAWGLAYIKGGYGSPCAAWSHSVAVNWY